MIAVEMIRTAQRSAEELRARITEVKYEGDGIVFKLGGDTYQGELLGRNADLVLSGDAAIDSAIALRTLLDGNAQPIV